MSTPADLRLIDPKPDTIVGNVPSGLESPTGSIPFEVVRVDDNGNEIRDSETSTFDPFYYPDRFNTKGGKDIERSANQCSGETVEISTLKNEELHATGVMRSSQLVTFRKVAKHDGSVILYTPLQPQGGIEAVIGDWEIDGLDGWDPEFGEWLISWTLDFVSTGRDEYEGSTSNSTVSDILDEI